LIPELVKLRRTVYSSKLKPTEILEVLELFEEVLQEPIEERPQEVTVVHASELQEESDFGMDDLNQYLIHANQVDETKSGYNTIEAYLDPLRAHTSRMRLEGTGLMQVEGMVIAHHRLYTSASECLRQGDKKQAISLAGAVQILQELIEAQCSAILNKIGSDRKIKEWARISNEMHATKVEKRAQRKETLEKVRSRKYTNDFTKPLE
jgi:hypothetical protein